MNRRRSNSSIVANPVLVGAVTTLVVLVACFLAYNANNGLPFVPTKALKVQIDNGSNLVKGNDVREGGFRIGVVESLDPIELEGGQVGAELTLKLDEKNGPIPKDSTVKIRPRSALGLKYVELTRGNSEQIYEDGDTMPASRTVVPVQFDDVFRMFDEPTRDAAQGNLEGFGNAFLGRGPALNETIASLPEFLRYLEPVATNLAAEQTQLGRFFRELGDTARVLAPVADVQAQGIGDAATTFEAFSRDEEALKDTISGGPPTLREGIESFPVQRPFLDETAVLSRDIRLAAAELPRTLPTINAALEEGTPVIQRTTELNDELRQTFDALRDLTEAPTTNIALRGLTATVTTLNPQLRYLGPYITVCNYWNYFWTTIADHFTESDPTGQSQRALLNSTAQQPNSVGSAGATEPANGDPFQPGAVPSHLHGQPYGSAVNEDGTADCEQHQRGYVERAGKFGDQKYRIAIGSNTPGSQGPLFDSLRDAGKPLAERKLGPARVPAGQTFTRTPETGFKLP